VRSTLVKRNHVFRAGGSGILVGNPTTTLTRNEARYNHRLGIEAVEGVIEWRRQPGERKRRSASIRKHRVSLSSIFPSRYKRRSRFLAFVLQHADEHRPEGPVLLTVDHPAKAPRDRPRRLKALHPMGWPDDDVVIDAPADYHQRNQDQDDVGHLNSCDHGRD
jgi:hypothetical protein